MGSTSFRVTARFLATQTTVENGVTITQSTPNHNL
jgi:hypothetical protein